MWVHTCVLLWVGECVWGLVYMYVNVGVHMCVHGTVGACVYVNVCTRVCIQGEGAHT